LERQVQEAQARVVATIEAKHGEFVSASEQISELRSSVARLRTDLQSAAVLLGRSAPGADEANAAAAAKSAAQRLHASVAEHRALREELQALEAAAVVLTTMLSAQKQLGDLEALSVAARYGEAAELTLAIAESLQGISAADNAAEPALVRAVKMQYYQKRAILVTRLEDALGSLIAFGPGPRIVARRSSLPEGASGPGAAATTTLHQVWDALHVLELRGRRIEQLAETAHRKVFAPLLEAARRLPVGRELQPSVVVDPSHEGVTWRWVEVDDGVGIENIMPHGNMQLAGKAGAEGRLRLVQCVLPSLESLLQFVQDHWTGGLNEVFVALGKRLWPHISRALLQHFDTCSRDGGEGLEKFEAAMLRAGLIKSTEKTLSRHVHQHRHALGEQRRTSVLSEIREWLLQEDGALVKVCDADEPGSITQLLQETMGEEPKLAASAPECSSSDGGFVCEKLRSALNEDAGLLRLPSMHVSPSVRRLVDRLRSLMEEIVTSVEHGRSEVAHDLNKLVRELCTLFAVLRPHAQKAQLKTNARCCAVFLADCLYLVHVLILMPYTYGARLPSEHRQLSFFVDLVPQLRRLGENHFFAMLRHHQEQLVSTLRPCDLGPGLSRDRTFIAAEAALGAAAQQAKAAVQGLAAALPEQLLREVAGVIVGMICQNLLGKLFALQHLAPDEVSCVTALFTAALAMSRQAFAAAGLADGTQRRKDGTLDDDVPGWAALTLVADLLGSEFSRFLERRGVLVKVLNREEAVRLMQLSWRDEPIAPEEAWAVLAGGAD